MCLDKRILLAVIDGNKRFKNPFEVPEPYFIVNAHGGEKNSDTEMIELYYDKLRYAVRNADSLIESVFDETFYDFYGVNKNQVESPAKMCLGLCFDSFTLNTKDVSVCAYLSNDRFMFGHFIEVLWDSHWNIKSIWIN